MTRVAFRTYPDGDVIALFPDEVERDGTVTCYVHVGQHGGADYTGVVRRTRPATEEEAAELRSELESVGYDDLKPIKRYTSGIGLASS